MHIIAFAPHSCSPGGIKGIILALGETRVVCVVIGRRVTVFVIVLIDVRNEGRLHMLAVNHVPVDLIEPWVLDYFSYTLLSKHWVLLKHVC